MKQLLILVDKIGKKKETLAYELSKYLGKDTNVTLGKFSDLVFELDGEHVKVNLHGRNLQDFGLIYLRRVGIDYFTLAQTLAVSLENLKIKFFDTTFAAANQSGDKLTNLTRLSLAGLPTIPTFFCWRDHIDEHIDYLVNKFGLPLVAKKITGQRGTGVFLLREKADFKKVLDENNEGQFMFQKFYPNDEEYRLLVLGEKVGVWERKIRSDPEEFRANVALGAKEEFLDIKKLPEEMSHVAVHAAKTLKLQIAGVDILIAAKTGEMKLLEINRGPGLTYDTKVSPELGELAAFFKRELNDKV